MTFTKLNLSGQRVLIKGTDSQGTTGQTIVSSEEWTEVLRHTGTSQAQKDFDASVEKFFAPITDAAEALTLQFNDRVRDPLSFVSLQEGVAPTAGQEEAVIRLSHDSMVLRALDEGHDDRLIWVGDTLEILEVLPGTESVTATGNGDGGDPHNDEG